MTAPIVFTPKGARQLVNTLPELQARELQLRAIAAAAGILYEIADYGALRTPADTAQLLKWRSEAIANARKSAEDAARKAKRSAAQVKAAGDAAAAKADYRVSPFESGKHGVGAAFDIKIVSTPKGMTTDAAYAYLGARAKECGLTWGGTFSAPRDIYHFELTATRAQLEPKWKAYAATNVVKSNVGKGGAVLPIIIFGIVVAGTIALALTSRDGR